MDSKINKKEIEHYQNDILELDNDILKLEKKESKLKILLKRFYIILISFFIIFLLFLNLFGYHTLNILSGKIVSKEINENFEFNLNDKKIIFGKENYLVLKDIFLKNQNAEIKICVIGSIEYVHDNINQINNININEFVKETYTKETYTKETYNNDSNKKINSQLSNYTKKIYKVYGFYIPKIFSNDVFSVTSQICNNKTIIDLHTHPILHCIFSEQDIKSYNQLKRSNPDLIMVLMCDEKRFNFYYD